MGIEKTFIVDRYEIVDNYNRILENIFGEAELSLHNLNSIVEFSKGLSELKKEHLIEHGYNHSEQLNTAVMA